MRKKPTEKLHPNSAQQDAINARDGIYQVVATAGSGKTLCLIERYKKLVASGVDPEEIVSLTFTKAAAKEMNKRAGAPDSSSAVRPYGFLTFHSLALSFATQERREFPFTLAAFPLATEGQANKLMGESARYAGVEFWKLQQQITAWKHENLKSVDVLSDPQQDLVIGYSEYEQRCKKLGVLDFDSLLLEMIRVLETKPEVLERWSYFYCAVDESQDCAKMQWDLIKLLSRKHGNLFAVGDANQAIFAFAFAHPHLFQNFGNMFPGAKKIYLGTNYRSSQELLGFQKKILPVQDELVSHLRAEKELGMEPEIVRYASNIEEADNIARRIPRLNSTTAVLARTNRGLGAVEDALAQAGIKYHLLGHSGFWQQPEIRNVLAFAQCAVTPFDNAVLAAIRTPFHYSRYLHKKELIEELTAIKKEQEDPIWGAPSMFDIATNYIPPEPTHRSAYSRFVEYLKSLVKYKNVPADQAIKSMISDLHAVEYYTEEEEYAHADNGPKENLGELIKAAGRFSTLRELLAHTARANAAARCRTGVAVGTIHSAKGLQWHNVFMISVNDGMLPHSKGDLEEEKRIFYVGCSRAEELLSISCWGTPSRFLAPFIKSPATGQKEE